MVPSPLRASLIAGPHPDDPERWLVLDPERGLTRELSALAHRLAQLFDGARDTAALARAAATQLGEAVEEQELRRLASTLARLRLLEPRARSTSRSPARRGPAPLGPVTPQWTVAPTPRGAELVTHPEARFGCQLAGTCCRSGYLIPLSGVEATALRAAGTELLGPERDVVTLAPSRPGQAWSWVLDNERGCPFLVDDRRCGLHARPEQPRPCRTFPITFVAADDARLHVSVTHRCVCGALDRGPRLADSEAELRARLDPLPAVASLPPTVRLDVARSVDRSRAVAALVEVTASADEPWTMLAAAARALAGTREETPLPRMAPARLLAALARRVDRAKEPLLVAALEGRPHPARRMIRRDLIGAGLFDPRADATKEAARFVRDHLFGLHPFRAPTLAWGLGALALALARILEALPAAAHPAVRERILLWEDALSSPEALAVFDPQGPAGVITGAMEALPAAIEALRLWSGRRVR
jgi:hypothetical protein